MPPKPMTIRCKDCLGIGGEMVSDGDRSRWESCDRCKGHCYEEVPDYRFLPEISQDERSDD